MKFTIIIVLFLPMCAFPHG